MMDEKTGSERLEGLFEVTKMESQNLNPDGSIVPSHPGQLEVTQNSSFPRQREGVWRGKCQQEGPRATYWYWPGSFQSQPPALAPQ